MDYILFGIGSGASLALIGWLLRELGPRLRDGRIVDGEILSARELIDRMSWSRFCSSCGMALALGGTVILLATAIVAIWNPGDDLATNIMFGMYGFISLLMIIWAILYTRQFGTSGIYRPVQRKPIPPTTEAIPEQGVSPETTSLPVEEGESPAVEPEPDFETVAASRGGLGRFAAFFHRDRELTSESETDTQEAISADDEAEVAVAAGEEEAANTDVPETEDATVFEETQFAEDASESGEGDGATDRAIDDDVSATTDATGPTEMDTSTSDDETIAPAPAAEDEPPNDLDDAEVAGETGSSEQPPVSPEEDAVAALRRRRLARLSDTDQA